MSAQNVCIRSRGAWSTYRPRECWLRSAGPETWTKARQLAHSPTGEVCAVCGQGADGVFVRHVVFVPAV